MARTIKQSEFEKKDFVPQDLIEKLTASVDLKQQQNSQNTRKGFVPKAYLENFENAIEQIRLLRNDVDEEINKSSKTSKEDEAKYKSQLSGFMTDLQKIMHDFRILDGGISKVSQTAIRIGDRLENVEEQRQQILESEELIEHFLRFNKDKKYRDIDDMFFAETGDDLYRAAKLIIKLHEIGTDLTLPETQNARDEITIIAKRIREKLKNEFVRAYRGKREDNHKEMKQCATILDEFNDIQAFEEFRTLYLEDIDYNSYPSTSFQAISECIGRFMTALSRVIENATISIVRVFPKPELVIKDLIIQAFEDQILSFLMNATQPMLLGYEFDTTEINEEPTFERSSGFRDNNVITHSTNASNLTKLSKKDLDEYLSIVNIVYLNANDLLSDLKQKLLEIVFNDDGLLSKQSGGDKRTKLYSIGHILSEEKLLKIVFEKHQQNYLKLEEKHLKNELKGLIREHVIGPLKLEDHGLSDDEDDDIHDAETDGNIPTLDISITPMHMMEKTHSKEEDKKGSNLLSAFRTRTATGSKKSAAQLLRTTRSYSHKKLKVVKNMLPKSMSSKEFEELLGRLRSVFQFGINECVATMKKKVSISLKRCINISPQADLSYNIRLLFLIYLEAVEILFRKTLIPICKETLPKRGSKEIKHWYFLEAVHHTNSALQLVEQCFIYDVTPSITDTFEFSICKQDKNRVYRAFEANILSGLKDLLSSGLNIMETIIRKEQQKSDFKPKPDDVMNLSATKACISVCQFIDQFRGRSLICLDGRNLDRFFLCLGTRVYYDIVGHFKDYQYNPTGAMILVLDAKKYQETVKQFHIERINELFLTLVERTNLISIPADSIVPYIDGDSKLSKIPKNELKQWLKLRTDYKSSKIDSKLFD